MTYKKQLIDLIEDCKNIHGDINTVELTSGIKDSDHFVPNILNYLNYPPYSERGEVGKSAWFVEIWINNKCIWRKHEIIEENPKGIYEEELCKKILREIMIYGLLASRDVIEKKEKNNVLTR